MFVIGSLYTHNEKNIYPNCKLVGFGDRISLFQTALQGDIVIFHSLILLLDSLINHNFVDVFATPPQLFPIELGTLTGVETDVIGL